MASSSSIQSNFVSMKPAVEFVNVLDQYSHNEDLVCTFRFNEYTPQPGDKVALYKLGWNFVKDYILFEWVSVNDKQKGQSVTLSKHGLPKDSNEMYQICYISGENIWHGASCPFQFSPVVPPIVSQNNFSSCIPGIDTCDRSKNGSRNTDEIGKLREENEMLRESLKAVIAQKNRQDQGQDFRNYDSQISDLKEITRGLKEALDLQQKEINMLKVKIANGGEEYKKLYLAKLKLEKKYDKLKNGVEKCDSEVINFDIDDLKSIPPFPFSK